MLLVNQLNAKIKLLEMWKATHVQGCPINTINLQREEDVVITRACAAGQLKEYKLTNNSERTFINDATHIWNLGPK